jgi:hypothetical protein
MKTETPKDEPQVYAIRPDRTAIWLPESLAAQLGVSHGAHLTAAQYESQPVQTLISERMEKQKGKPSR